MSDWRKNPNLVECYDSFVAMLRGTPKARPPSRGEIIHQRRLALGLTQRALAEAAGYMSPGSAALVSRAENNTHWMQRVADTLDRLEAEREAAE